MDDALMDDVVGKFEELLKMAPSKDLHELATASFFNKVPGIKEWFYFLLSFTVLYLGQFYCRRIILYLIRKYAFSRNYVAARVCRLMFPQHFKDTEAASQFFDMAQQGSQCFSPRQKRGSIAMLHARDSWMMRKQSNHGDRASFRRKGTGDGPGTRVWGHRESMQTKWLNRMKTGTRVDPSEALFGESAHFDLTFCLFLSSYLVFDMTETYRKFSLSLATILLVYRVVAPMSLELSKLFELIVKTGAEMGGAGEGGPGYDSAGLHLASVFVRFVVWLCFIFFALFRLGFDVSYLVTGLGIGGLTIGFALQTTLNDIFATLSLVFDRWMKVGEKISVLGEIGEIEHIGIRSTRIRCQSEGQLLIIPNSILWENGCQNFASVTKRRVILPVLICISTPLEKLKRIPQILSDAVDKVEEVEEVGGCWLAEILDYYYKYELMYYLGGHDEAFYRWSLHKVNIAIVTMLTKQKISLGLALAAVTSNVGADACAAAGFHEDAEDSEASWGIESDSQAMSQTSNNSAALSHRSKSSVRSQREKKESGMSRTHGSASMSLEAGVRVRNPSGNSNSRPAPMGRVYRDSDARRSMDDAASQYLPPPRGNTGRSRIAGQILARACSSRHILAQQAQLARQDSSATESFKVVTRKASGISLNRSGTESAIPKSETNRSRSSRRAKTHSSVSPDGLGRSAMTDSKSSTGSNGQPPQQDSAEREKEREEKKTTKPDDTPAVSGMAPTSQADSHTRNSRPPLIPPSLPATSTHHSHQLPSLPPTSQHSHQHHSGHHPNQHHSHESHYLKSPQGDPNASDDPLGLKAFQKFLQMQQQQMQQQFAAGMIPGSRKPSMQADPFFSGFNGSMPAGRRGRRGSAPALNMDQMRAFQQQFVPPPMSPQHVPPVQQRMETPEEEDIDEDDIPPPVGSMFKNDEFQKALQKKVARRRSSGNSSRHGQAANQAAAHHHKERGRKPRASPRSEDECSVAPAQLTPQMSARVESAHLSSSFKANDHQSALGPSSKGNSTKGKKEPGHRPSVLFAAQLERSRSLLEQEQDKQQERRKPHSGRDARRAYGDRSQSHNTLSVSVSGMDSNEDGGASIRSAGAGVKTTLSPMMAKLRQQTRMIPAGSPAPSSALDASLQLSAAVEDFEKEMEEAGDTSSPQSSRSPEASPSKNASPFSMPRKAGGLIREEDLEDEEEETGKGVGERDRKARVAVPPLNLKGAKNAASSGRREF
uniref:Mechanosensitive ion channel protein n=1 Tax=Chromera velia CCMP2878 TaxID=1169474 RepID=A0A0G4HFT6_9ALVE|eukprot:Cvel_27149.t1-p1 / transcript=Cvel_27149.t1 / gene=Cvel_27149 / organism=Chromera_velia_CCMP2878 / gene_product=Large-conductance mechanosensitive channel MscMJLR, putative / transcript_product=Large-conductance mechanosensitive channel MscMJLR, putative / location=Cvel_scaffold3341:4933-11674(-) / protein_length=1222 / sequence_SO=supercontig / SO=protein_coding / is_pseudo=false